MSIKNRLAQKYWQLAATQSLIPVFIAGVMNDKGLLHSSRCIGHMCIHAGYVARAHGVRRSAICFISDVQHFSTVDELTKHYGEKGERLPQEDCPF